MEFIIKIFAEGDNVFPLDHRVVENLREHINSKFNTEKFNTFKEDWLYEVHIFYETDIDDIFALPSNEFKKEKANTFIYLVPLTILDYNDPCKSFIELLNKIMKSFFEDNLSEHSYNEEFLDGLDIDHFNSFAFPAKDKDIKYFQAK